MAVQARYLAHAFRHDGPRAAAVRPAVLDLDDGTGASSSVVFLGDHDLLLSSRGNATTVFGDDDPRSELTCRNVNNNDGRFVPRKRARVAAGDDAGACSLMIMEGHGHAGPLPPQVPVPVPTTKAFVGNDDALCSGEHGCGAASTSGRPAAAVSSLGLLSLLHRHGVEIDALVRIENERLRAGLEEARRRHVRAVVSALERAAAQRLQAAEADLARAVLRGAELEERLRQVVAEAQAWRGVANGHEAAAAGLRASLDQLLLQQQHSQPPCAGAEGDAAVPEDARSCCFEQEGLDEPAAATMARACRSCGEAGACVLLLPCRHLCLCAACEAAAEDCPVCAATKNASLHVLLA